MTRQRTPALTVAPKTTATAAKTKTGMTSNNDANGVTTATRKRQRLTSNSTNREVRQKLAPKLAASDNKATKQRLPSNRATRNRPVKPSSSNLTPKGRPGKNAIKGKNEAKKRPNLESKKSRNVEKQIENQVESAAGPNKDEESQPQAHSTPEQPQPVQVQIRESSPEPQQSMDTMDSMSPSTPMTGILKTPRRTPRRRTEAERLQEEAAFHLNLIDTESRKVLRRSSRLQGQSARFSISPRTKGLLPTPMKPKQVGSL